MTPAARRAAIAWLPPLLWCALVFAGSSVSVSTGRRLFPGADRVVHVAEYGVLGLLLARALGATLPAAPGRRILLLAGVLGTAYGATDELHQRFVPAREAEWGDLAADAAGSLLGAAAWASFASRRRGADDAPATGSASAPARSPGAPPGP